MANDEHVAILRKGVDAWNKWRAQYPEVKPDLTRADLRRENVSKANLSGVKLGDAYLSEAVLDAAPYAVFRTATESNRAARPTTRPCSLWAR